MPTYIVKIGENRYLEWSTVVDAPVSVGMSRDEMKDRLTTPLSSPLPKEVGVDLERIELRLARADEYGTSVRFARMSAEDLVKNNRAGPEETELTFEELVDEYWE